MSLLAKVLNNAPMASTERNAAIPSLPSALVMRLLHEDATGRPQSADELGVLLAQIA